MFPAFSCFLGPRKASVLLSKSIFQAPVNMHAKKKKMHATLGIRESKMESQLEIFLFLLVMEVPC
jgi:hypothetical protein